MSNDLLTADAQRFLTELEREFRPQRRRLLAARSERQARLDAGERPTFLPETAKIREGRWTVASAPQDLEDRRVEITGPAEPKMMINGLNSGAQGFMADLEDSLSPTWANILLAQDSLYEAVRGTLRYDSPDKKTYRLQPYRATLLMRPRGWHLEEKHFQVDGEPCSASLFDFGLFFFHNASELLARRSGPYFYIPKLESHLEARLWNQVFVHAQRRLGIPVGSIRVTVLIETVLAAFEMDEILYELRDHASGLNAGRWDYIFSAIKKFRNDPAFILPDRSRVTMTVPFMRAYTELLVRTCHRRGAHAIGGMSAFIPSRKDAAVNEIALARVREDKEREALDGFDGTWVAHPDLVGLAASIFDSVLGKRLHQKDWHRDAAPTQDPSPLLGIASSGRYVTEEGFRLNVEIALQYLERWMSGQGAVAIHNLMEDAATAEISRAQIWQWIRHSVPLEGGAKGGRATRELYVRIRNEELHRLGSSFEEAASLLDRLVLSDSFPEFLTSEAYPQL